MSPGPAPQTVVGPAVAVSAMLAAAGISHLLRPAMPSCHPGCRAGGAGDRLGAAPAAGTARRARAARGHPPHEEYLAAVLGRQVASRTANGTRMRIASAHFPAVKTIEDFSFDHVPTAPRDVIAHWPPPTPVIVIGGLWLRSLDPTRLTVTSISGPVGDRY